MTEAFLLVILYCYIPTVKNSRVQPLRQSASSGLLLSGTAVLCGTRIVEYVSQIAVNKCPSSLLGKSWPLTFS